jgi:AcrR family transcriptional regulator/DNA-binding MarR family transcriptional regulator
MRRSRSGAGCVGRGARGSHAATAQPPSVAGVLLQEGLPRDHVLEIQRSRLLVGAVGAIEEHGYGAVTVAQITARARVSRRTFYELFDDREACLAALLEDVLSTLEEELTSTGLEGLEWRERVRSALSAILSYFDREPALARVCVVEALRGGQQLLGRREEILKRLAGALDEGRTVAGQRGRDCSPLTAEGLVGAAFGIVHARLLRKHSKPLLGLVPELMGMFVLPYLGPAAARREQTRPTANVSASARSGPWRGRVRSEDPLQGLQMRLTYRTARVLDCIAEQPGVSNRQVADLAGIHDQGQVSKLLMRLQRLGLVTNTGEGHSKGEPNRWSLTPLGEQVTQRLSVSGESKAA